MHHQLLQIAGQWPPLRERHQQPNHAIWHDQPHRPLRLPKHQVRRDSGVGHQDASSQSSVLRWILCLRGKIGSCHLLLGVRIEDPVAKLTLPIALRVPVRLHPLSAGWATPSSEHPSAPSPVGDPKHHPNQNREGERKKSRAKHHNRSWWEQKDGRQSNQESNGVKPEASQAPAPPLCSKNAVYGHERLILGLTLA